MWLNKIGLFSIACSIFIPALAQEIGYEQLPAEMKLRILTHLGTESPVNETLKTIASLRAVNRESCAFIKKTGLITKLLSRSSCWRNTALAKLPPRMRPYYGLLHYCFKIETEEYLLVSHAETPHSELQRYLQSAYTDEEKAAICSYMEAKLISIPNDETEHLFFRNLLSALSNKTILLHFLLYEAEQFYSCTFISFNARNLGATFSYKSLEAQKKMSTLLPVRFEKFKLLLPFYTQMLTFGAVPLQLPTLIRSQVQEFGDYCKTDLEKAELLSICILLLPLEYDSRYKSMYKAYAEELSAMGPLKRIAVKNAQVADTLC